MKLMIQPLFLARIVIVMKVLLLSSTATMVIGFHTTKAPFGTRNVISRYQLSKSTSYIAATLEDSHESCISKNVVDQWEKTSSKVVTTFLFGWTLAASVAMATTDAPSVVMMDESTSAASPLEYVLESSSQFPILDESVFSGTV
jgi:hypothetical protein